MDNIKEFYIIGDPIDTRIGKLYPVTVKEYPYFIKHIGTLQFDKRDLLFYLSGMVSQNEEMRPIFDLANSIPLFNFITYFIDESYKGSFI